MREKIVESHRAIMLGHVLRLISVLLAASVFVPGAKELLPALCMFALCIPMERAKLPLVGFSYVVLQDFALRFSLPVSITTSILFTVLLGGYLLLYAAKGETLAPPLPLHLAITICAAVIMTFYQCAGYFATGAHGAGLSALLRSYRNLGFHPNWRTVLFSTIMMVVLITWPRKFPRLSQILPSGFVGLAIVTVLNTALYWDPARSPVPELWITRIPVSALSMLLIFIAWEEIPWKRLRAYSWKQFAVLFSRHSRAKA